MQRSLDQHAQPERARACIFFCFCPPICTSPPPAKPECFLVFLNYAAALPSASASLLRRHYLADVFLPSSICSSIGAAAFSARVPRIAETGSSWTPAIYRLRSRSRPSPAHRYPLFSVYSSTSAQTPLLEQVRWSDAHRHPTI